MQLFPPPTGKQHYKNHTYLCNEILNIYIFSIVMEISHCSSAKLISQVLII